jgi:predicted dehydrogenase
MGFPPMLWARMNVIVMTPSSTKIANRSLRATKVSRFKRLQVIVTLLIFEVSRRRHRPPSAYIFQRRRFYGTSRHEEVMEPTEDSSGSGRKLGVAFIGSGFINTFHAKGWVSVRDADIVAVFDPVPERAKALTELCQSLGIGSPACYTDLTETLQNKDVQAVWLGVPNHARLPTVKAITEEIIQGKSNVRGIACEKPLATNVGQAKEMVSLVEKAGISHGYLENQIFSPSLRRGKEILWKYGSGAGRPFLARASEEHGGPHSSWFWQPKLSGGGVMMDMMCHSLEATRFLLSDPSDVKKEGIKVKDISAQTASLKWSKPRYAKQLLEMTKGEVDYSKLKVPPEDFAKALVTYESSSGELLMAETTVSWCFTGPGLRLLFELIGPEYYMNANSLQTDLQVFFGRNVIPETGEYMIEKQAAEQGLMPTVANEAFTYGYESEDIYMAKCFREGKLPSENWHDGLFVLQLLMSCYLSADRGKRVEFSPSEVESYVPRCVTGA